jgi:acetylglutamate kinase
MRVTDGETMDVVEMVLVGKVNKEIVGLINHCGGKAVGLSGTGRRSGLRQKTADEHAGQGGGAQRGPAGTDRPRPGRPGDQDQSQVLECLSQADFIPVIAPVGVGEDGQALISMPIWSPGPSPGSWPPKS